MKARKPVRIVKEPSHKFSETRQMMSFPPDKIIIDQQHLQNIAINGWLEVLPIDRGMGEPAHLPLCECN